MGQNQTQENKSGRNVSSLLFFFLLSIFSNVLAILCLSQTPSGFVQRNFLALGIAVCVVACLLFAFSAWLVFYKKERIRRGLMSFYVLLLVSLAIWLLLQKTNFFQLIDTPEKLQEYLRKAGVWMPILYIVLQFLQVIILPIPSIVSTIAGVALFGSFWAMIYSLAGILLGSVTAFFIGRKVGNKAVAWMVGEETLNKWQKKLKGKDNLFLTLMFFLPLFPDDILCFIAGLSTMTTRYFLIVVLLARFIGIFATCYSINFIPFTSWWGIMVWGVLMVCFSLGFILMYKNIDKIQRFYKRIQRKK